MGFCAENMISLKILSKIIKIIRIRSHFLKTVFVKHESNEAEESDFLMSESLSRFIQAHSTTLETLLLENINYSTRNHSTALADNNVLIPSELKYLRYAEFPDMGDRHKNAYILHLAKRLTKLEEFIVEKEWFIDDSVLFPTSFPEMVDICTNNVNSIKFIKIIGKIYPNLYFSMYAFRLCSKLEYLYINFLHRSNLFLLHHLTKLPSSLKILNISHDKPVFLCLELDHLREMNKFRNLVQFVLDFTVRIKTYTILLNITQALLRLPKLEFLFIKRIRVTGPDHLESYAMFREICHSLCGNNTPQNEEPKNDFELKIELKTQNHSTEAHVTKGYYTLCGYKTSHDKLLEELNDMHYNGSINNQEIFSKAPMQLDILTLQDLIIQSKSYLSGNR